MLTVTETILNDEITLQIIQNIKSLTLDILKNKNKIDVAELFKLLSEKTSYVHGTRFFGAIFKVEGPQSPTAFNVLKNVSLQFGQALNFLLIDEKKIMAKFMSHSVDHFRTDIIPVVRSNDLESYVEIEVSLV